MNYWVIGFGVACLIGAWLLRRSDRRAARREVEEMRDAFRWHADDQ